MKRLRFLLMMLAIASVGDMVHASSSGEGLGAKTYVAMGLAGLGAAGGAYKLYGRYQAGRAKEAQRQTSIAVKQKRFDDVVDKLKAQINVKNKELNKRLEIFLLTSGEFYEACAEGVDKLQELITKLEEMDYKIVHAHVPHTKLAYSPTQQRLLSDVKEVLAAVKFQQNFAQRWALSVDTSYENFIREVEARFANCLTGAQPTTTMQTTRARRSEYGADDSEDSEMRFERTLASFRDDRRPSVSWQERGGSVVPRRAEVASRELVESLSLPEAGRLKDVVAEIQRHYKIFVGNYESLMNQYNREYGSYFTRLKGHFSSYFKGKEPVIAPSTSVAPAVSVAPVAAK